MPKKLMRGQEGKKPQFSVSCEQGLKEKFEYYTAQENLDMSKKVRKWMIDYLIALGVVQYDQETDKVRYLNKGDGHEI